VEPAVNPVELNATCSDALLAGMIVPLAGVTLNQGNPTGLAHDGPLCSVALQIKFSPPVLLMVNV
jgi:hypothetical protein